MTIKPIMFGVSHIHIEGSHPVKGFEARRMDIPARVPAKADLDKPECARSKNRLSRTPADSGHLTECGHLRQPPMAFTGSLFAIQGNGHSCATALDTDDYSPACRKKVNS